jgi:Uri superfamily endonuclease
MMRLFSVIHIPHVAPLAVVRGAAPITSADRPRKPAASTTHAVKGRVLAVAKLPSEVARVTGSYVLIITLDRPRRVEVGALGEIDVPAGAYAYVGSAMGGLNARIARHLRDDKRLHWHIDYLLQHAEVAEVVRVESDERLECRIATGLAERLPVLDGFGSTDCACAGHLFGPATLADSISAVKAAVAAAGNG